MKKLLFTIVLIFPLITFSQNNNTKPEKRFYPFIALNYNMHNIYSYSYYDSHYPSYLLNNSNFFGAEFGFTLRPKTENGLYFDYINKLDAELGIKGIYDIFNSEKGDLITDNNISSGFFGTLNIGKQIYKNEISNVIVGISIGDKYVSGVTGNFLKAPGYGEYDGFHFTPGIFGKIQTKLNNKFSLELDLTLSQSVMNFWRFAENGNDFNFKHPFFADFSVKIKHKSGFYIVLQNNYLIPFNNKQTYTRNSIGIGFTF